MSRLGFFLIDRTYTTARLKLKMKSINEFYGQERRKIGSRVEVARLLGINPRTLERRETGKYRITEEMLAALELFKSKSGK